MYSVCIQSILTQFFISNDFKGYLFSALNHTTFGQPSWIDLSVTRQRLYDALYDKSPPQMLMTISLEDSQSKSFHYTDEQYDWLGAMFYASGVGLSLKGSKLFNNNATKASIQKWSFFYKSYRDILSSSVVHIRRPNMQNIDGLLHVNPTLIDKGLLVLFNPSTSPRSEHITIPLYYTGLTDTAMFRRNGDAAQNYTLDRLYNVEMNVTLDALQYDWFVIQ